MLLLSGHSRRPGSHNPSLIYLTRTVSRARFDDKLQTDRHTKNNIRTQKKRIEAGIRISSFIAGKTRKICVNIGVDFEPSKL